MSSVTNVLELKRLKTVEALSRGVGLVVRGKSCVVIMLKSAHAFIFSKSPDDKSNIFVWTIGGSDSDIRNYKIELFRFCAQFSNLFSERDLNLQLLHDFTCGYLRQRFYNMKSAEPAIVEFILGEVTQNSMSFYTINHEGTSEILDQQNRSIDVVGCGDNEAKRKLVSGLAALKLENLTWEEIIKRVEPKLKSFFGDFSGQAFVISNKAKKRRK